jgi:hypothetical protein
MSTDEMKQIRAEKAKAKYKTDPSIEQKRKFLYRIRKGTIPTITSMTKHGFTLAAVNIIRKEAKLDELQQSDIKGYRKEQMNLMVTNKEQVLKSVIPNVHVFENSKKAPNSKQPVKEINIDLSANITLDVYLQCLRNKPVSAKTVDLYEGRLKPLLTALGWKNKKKESIVPYLKEYENVEQVINNLTKKEGEQYAQSTIRSTYQAISTGLHKQGCPAFYHQISKEAPDAINFYTRKTNKYTQDGLEVRREKPKTADYPAWEDMVAKADEIANDTTKSLKDRVFVQLYAGMNAAPRISTFLNLHVVDKQSETEDQTKNYYVKDTQTVISNIHKTGVDKETGKAIIEPLTKYPALAQNIKELAKDNKILFKMQQTYASKRITDLFGETDKGKKITNTLLRHSNTYWALNKGTPAQLDHALRINAHDYKTARDFYAKIEPTTDEKPVVTEEPAPAKFNDKTQKAVKKNTRGDAINNIVQAMLPKPAPMKAAKVIKEVVPPKKVPKPKPAPMKATKVIKETPIQVKPSVETPMVRRSSRNK